MLGVEYLEIGTASTMTNFNGGYQDMFKVFQELGITPGESCVNFWEKKIIEFNLREKKATLACKRRRKKMRTKRKGFADADEKQEDVTYESEMC